MAKKGSRPASEQQVIAALAARFEAPAFIFLPHVRNATGYASRVTRTADALAFGTWPSRGIELHGIEVKSDRRDWLRELRDPEKAEEIARFCDRWWVAVGEDGIVADGELPPAWGLLVWRGDKLVMVKDAPQLQPQAWPRSFIASLLRTAVAVSSAKSRETHELERAAYQRGQEAAEKSSRSAAEHWKQAHDRVMEMIADFQEATGLHVSTYRAREVGAAVRAVTSGDAWRRELEQMRLRARQIADSIDAALGTKA